MYKFHEHALEQGSESKAIAYFQVDINGVSVETAAIHADILTASLNAVLNALNKYFKQAPEAKREALK